MNSRTKLVALEDVIARIRNGLSVKQSRDVDGLPISRIETIADGTVDPMRVGYAGIKEGESDDWLLHRDDILISHINSVDHLGKCAIYEGKPAKLIHGMNLLGLRVNRSLADPRFFFYALRSPDFREQLPQITNQSVNQSSFSITNFRKLKVPLPPLSEQKRIAGILDQADGLRRKRQQALALTDQFLRSTFLDLFGDPITNPKRWPMARLGSLGHWASGGTPPRSQMQYFQGDIDWYSAGELNQRLLSPSKERISNDAIGVSGTKMFKAGTLLVGMYDTAAFKLGILPKAASSNQACANLDLKHQSCDLNWLFSNLEIMRPYFLSHRRGVRQKNLTLQMIKDFEIPLPSSELQRTYVTTMKTAESLKQRLLKSVSKQEAFFNGLVQRAFRGDL